MKKYVVTLTEDERKTLGDLKSKGTQRSQKILNALILLDCDEGEHQTERSTNEQIARVLHISMRKIDRVKKRFVEEGLDAALDKKVGRNNFRPVGVHEIGHDAYCPYNLQMCLKLIHEADKITHDINTAKSYENFFADTLVNTKAVRKGDRRGTVPPELNTKSMSHGISTQGESPGL